jgi:hypothetical protein
MAGIDTEHQPLGVGRGVGQHEPAVTGAQVDRRRGMGRGGIGQLADVHLGEVASSQETHERMILARRGGLTAARSGR